MEHNCSGDCVACEQERDRVAYEDELDHAQAYRDAMRRDDILLAVDHEVYEFIEKLQSRILSLPALHCYWDPLGEMQICIPNDLCTDCYNIGMDIIREGVM